MVLITGGAVLIARWTLRVLAGQARAAENAAKAAKTSADALMLAERAYLSISHHPPGLTLDDTIVTRPGDEEFGGWREARLRFSITNTGNTPARITDVCMYHVVAPPSALPPAPVGPGTGDRLFLVRGDAVHDRRSFEIRNVDRNQLGLTKRLWILGYVDYIDAFNARRRAGYARYYDPDVDDERLYADGQGLIDGKLFRQRNNLLFVTEPGYNYDRLRKPAEGRDWSEPLDEPA